MDTCVSTLEATIAKEKELEELMEVDPTLAKSKYKALDAVQSGFTEATIYGDEWDVAKRYASAKEFDLGTKQVHIILLYYVKKHPC